MSYAHTHTDQKFDSPLKHPTRNDPFLVYRCRGVLHTPHKSPWPWVNDLSARYVSIQYVFIESYTRKKLDSPLKPPTPNDPFFVYPCRGVLHTPHKCPWQWEFESPARYAPIKYVFVESYTRQKFDSPLSIESSARYVRGRMQYVPTLTDQKIDSPLKSPTPNDPFFVYRCRGVWHTPHEYP